MTVWSLMLDSLAGAVGGFFIAGAWFQLWGLRCLLKGVDGAFEPFGEE